MKLVHFYQRFLLDSPNKTYQFKSSDRSPHTLSIEHTNNYDGSNRPSSTDITIHKITKEHINLIIKAFQNNTVVSLWAGWFNEDYTESDIKLVVSGTISNITPLKKTDSDISFTIKDGVDYSAEKTIKIKQRKKSKNIRLKASMPNEQSLVTNYEVRLDVNYLSMWVVRNITPWRRILIKGSLITEIQLLSELLTIKSEWPSKSNNNRKWFIRQCHLRKILMVKLSL